MIRWRAAKSTDDEDVIGMYRALYDEDPSPEPPSIDRVRQTLARFRDHPDCGRAVVLEVEGRIAGYAFLVAFWSNELGGEICVIDEIYVQPNCRGHGYATSLIKSLSVASELWPRQPVALELEITPTNARARGLYERLGFSNKRNTTMRLLSRK